MASQVCVNPLGCVAIHELNSNVAELNSKFNTLLGVVQLFFNSWKESERVKASPPQAVREEEQTPNSNCTTTDDSMQPGNDQPFAIKTEIESDATEDHNPVPEQKDVPEPISKASPVINPKSRRLVSDFDPQPSTSSTTKFIVGHKGSVKTYQQRSQWIGPKSDRHQRPFVVPCNANYRVHQTLTNVDRFSEVERRREFLEEQSRQEELITNEVKKDLFCVLIPDIDACLESYRQDKTFSPTKRPRIGKVVTSPDAQGNFTVRYYEGAIDGKWRFTNRRGTTEVINTATVLFCFDWVHDKKYKDKSKRLPSALRKRIKQEYRPVMKQFNEKIHELVVSE